MTQKYQIGDGVNFNGYSQSEVVGIDRYTLYSLTGATKHWVSYTLTDIQDKEDRWWLSDEPAGLYAWRPAPQDEIQGVIDLNESGLCVLHVEGDSTIESPYSSVAFYRADKGFYCLERFEGMDDVFSMRGERVR